MAFSLRKLFVKEKNISFLIFSIFGRISNKSFITFRSYCLTDGFSDHRQILGRFPLNDLKGAYLINK